MGSYQEFAELTALVEPGPRRARRRGLPARRTTETALARLEAGEQLGKIVLQPLTLAPDSSSSVRAALDPACRRRTARGSAGDPSRAVTLGLLGSPRRDRLRPGGVRLRGSRRAAALLHEPRRAGVRPRQPARGRQGGAVRPLQPQPQEPAPAVPRRVRRRPRHLRRPHDRRHRRRCAAPRTSTRRSSSSTATTRSPSSAASTWRASRRRTS